MFFIGKASSVSHFAVCVECIHLCSVRYSVECRVYTLETARVGFTCGPRVSKTGAAGAFTNKINMTKKHGKSNAASFNDDAHSSNKSDEIIEDEAEI